MLETAVALLERAWSIDPERRLYLEVQWGGMPPVSNGEFRGSCLPLHTRVFFLLVLHMFKCCLRVSRICSLKESTTHLFPVFALRLITFIISPH